MPDGEQSVGREELFAAFEPLRDSIKAILSRTRRSCGATDLKAAADKMGILTAGKLILPDDGWGYPMVCDLALFEANDRGIRPFDRFLAGPARTLPEQEQDLARRMGAGFFSLFKFTAKHEVGGVWVEDMLDNDRRIWIMDVALEERDVAPEVFAMRIFDAGQFCVSLGIIALASEKMVRICTTAQKTTGRLPFRRSLAATLYGLSLMDGRPSHPSGIKFARDLAQVLEDVETKASPKEGSPARGP